MNGQRLSGLGLGDALLLLETAATMMLVNIGLRVLPRRTLNLPRPDSVNTSPGILQSAIPARIAWAVSAISRRLPGGNTCLVQALTAHAMLRRRGFPSELRIGVAGNPHGAIRAHAWVECAGNVVVGEIDDLSTYAVLSAPGGA